MPKRRYPIFECPSRLFAHHMIGILFLIFLICFYSSAIAGIPAGRDVYIYNVDVGKFSVLWQVNIPSTCTVMVYNDINGMNEVQGYTSVSNTNASALAQARGLMQVDIKNLPLESTTYYFQTVSKEKTTGKTYVWPESGDLLSVTTEPFIPDPPPNNDLLELMLYDSNGIDQGNPLENLITDGAVALVDAGVNYPVSSDASGWPQNQSDNHHSVMIDFSKLRSGNGYFDWTSENADHTITIMCFGGLVPAVGLGQRIIQTIYPETMTQFGIDHSWYPCLSEFDIYDLDGCGFDTGNQIILESAQTSADADEDGHDAIVYGGDDCNDNDHTIFPNAPEACDGKDNDCDGHLGNGEVDADGDGYMVCDGDCDDRDAGVFPNAPGKKDGKDNDCNGKIDPDEKEPLGNNIQSWLSYMLYPGFHNGLAGISHYNQNRIYTFSGFTGEMYPSFVGIPSFTGFIGNSYPMFLGTSTFFSFPNLSWFANIGIENNFVGIGGLSSFIFGYDSYLFQSQFKSQLPQQIFPLQY